AQIKRDGHADDEQQHGADAGGPQRHRQAGEGIAVGKEELVGAGRKFAAALWRGEPQRLDDGGNDRPDDQPENENDRSRHEQEAERPPALDLLNSGGAEGGIGHAFGSSLGATARYQPSLTAFSQSPPGKVGMEDG